MLITDPYSDRLNDEHFFKEYIHEAEAIYKIILNSITTNDNGIQDKLNTWIKADDEGADIALIEKTKADLYQKFTYTLTNVFIDCLKDFNGKDFNNFIFILKHAYNRIKTRLYNSNNLDFNDNVAKFERYYPNTAQYFAITQDNQIFKLKSTLPSSFNAIEFCNKCLIEYIMHSQCNPTAVEYSLEPEVRADFLEPVLNAFLGSNAFKECCKFLKLEYPFPTPESFLDRLPKNVKKICSNPNVYNNVAIEFLKIKNKTDESDYIDFYEDNFFALLTNNSSYFNSTVSTSRYIDAVRFYTLISGGASYTSAFCTIFKKRAEETRKDIIDNNPDLDPSEVQKIFNDRISSKASAYAKGKLVAEVLSRDILPNSLRYYDARHKALNTLIDICSDESNSAKNRIEASNYILVHTNNVAKQDNQADFTEETRTTFLQSFINDLDKIGKIQKFLIEQNEITVEDASKQSIYDSEKND